MPWRLCTPYAKRVAPARERGLKSSANQSAHYPKCRSREGARIEITGLPAVVETVNSRSREGAWIEIPNTVGLSVLLMQMTYSG